MPNVDIYGYYAPNIASCSKYETCTHYNCKQEKNISSFNKRLSNLSFGLTKAREALQDRSSRIFNRLVNYKKNNIDDILKNDELSLQCAIVESCFTYAQENNYKIQNSEMFDLAENLSNSATKINKITNFNYFC